jgi:hypothetical protein
VPESGMYTLPAASTETPSGVLSSEDEAGPPSPSERAVPANGSIVYDNGDCAAAAAASHKRKGMDRKIEYMFTTEN